MAKKMQKLDTNDEHQEKVKVFRSWGVLNFLQVFPDGEKNFKFQKKKRYCNYQQANGYNLPTPVSVINYRHGKII